MNARRWVGGVVVVLAALGACAEAQAQGAMWLPGPWSACSAPCGGGAQTRSFQCVDTDRGTVLPDSSCASDPKPPDQMQACNTAACTYSWQVGAFGTCSEPCGDGIRTRPVTCTLDANGATVADSFCDASSRPAGTQACNLGACTYSWQTGAFGMCSEPCGDGTQMRPVTCISDLTGMVVAEALCDAGARPAGSQGCNLGACTYSWVAGAFGACSEPCGGGTSTREVMCVADLDGASVDDSLCEGGTRPTDTQACNEDPCPDAGSADAGALDAGVVDAGVVDAGVDRLDAGVVDAGELDAGVVDAGGDRLDAAIDGGVDPDAEPDGGSDDDRSGGCATASANGSGLTFLLLAFVWLRRRSQG
ncbi:MAG: thrombospondin type-1 domain-containing protein [Myxococcota bacterium]